MPNRRFKLQKSRQLFIRVHNETLAVAAMCVCNENYSPARIHGCDAAPTPTGVAEKADHCAVHFGMKSRSGQRRAARDTAQGKICLKKRK
jgi:hypothetical protein